MSLLRNLNLQNINLDRRQRLRIVPNELVFLQLERDDGGTVLDVSEGGLGFETFAPVNPNGPVHLVFAQPAGPDRGVGRSGLDQCDKKMRRPEVPAPFRGSP